MSLERLQPGTDDWLRYHADHTQRYRFFTSRYPNASVLDMACGVGYGSFMISNSGAKEVLGIDISDEAILFAKNNYQNTNLDFQLLDLSDVPKLGRRFDLVISFETIEHLPNPERLVEVANVVLNPGGRFVCSTPNKAKYSGSGIFNPYHVSELFYQDFQSLFAKYFRLERQYHQTESLSFQRFLFVQDEISALKSNLHQTPINRLKRLIRSAFGDDSKPPKAPEIFLPKESDFDLEQFTAFRDDFSVIILEGTKR